MECIQKCECEKVDKLTTWHNSPSSMYRIIYFKCSEKKIAAQTLPAQDKVLERIVIRGAQDQSDTLMVGSRVSAEWV